MGASLKIIAPTGQYAPTKLINWGINRWAFKPELGYSQRWGHWVLDGYGGVRFYTTNPAYYDIPEPKPQTEEPIGSFEGHLSYSLKGRAWASLDGNFWFGGVTALNSIRSLDTKQTSSRGAFFHNALSIRSKPSDHPPSCLYYGFLGHLLPGSVVMFTAVGYSSGPGIWMDDALEHEITQLLQAWRQGDERALDKLTPQVYREPHRAARRCMSRERSGHTLQTTALIHELYLRVSDLKLIDWQNRAHFFALCARQTRRILTDQARARRSHKRGHGAKAISLDDVLAISAP